MNALILRTPTYLAQIALPRIIAPDALAKIRHQATTVHAVRLCARAHLAQTTRPDVVALFTLTCLDIELSTMLTVFLVQGAVLAQIAFPWVWAFLTHAEQWIPHAAIHAIVFLAQTVFAQGATPWPCTMLTPTRAFRIKDTTMATLVWRAHAHITKLPIPRKVAVLALTKLGVQSAVVQAVCFRFGTSITELASPRVGATIARALHLMQRGSVLTIVRDFRAIRILRPICVGKIVWSHGQVKFDRLVDLLVDIMLDHEFACCDLVNEGLVILSLC